MTFIEAMYVGLFTLPVALAALSAVNRIARVRAPVVWFTVLAGRSCCWRV